MQIEEYRNELQQRYLQLDEDQKDIIRGFKDTEAGELFSYLLGPELSPLLSILRNPNPKQTMDVVIEKQPQTMAKGGLVNRRKKPVAKKK